MPAMNSAHDVVETLRSAPSVLIATHAKPDGDAIGSVLGLCRILRHAGIAARAVPVDALPERYAWMPGQDEIHAAGWQPTPDSDAILAVLDCGAVDRSTPLVEEWAAAQRPLMNIDHHLSNTRFGHVNWVDTSRSSVGEMVCALAAESGWEIPCDAAVALWVAIVTDTGRFAYQNTSPETLRVTAELLQHPIPTARIDQQIYQRTTVRQLRLQAAALAALELLENDRVALIALTRADFDALACGPEDAEDFVNLPRGIDGVHVAGFLYEVIRDVDGTPTTATKVSLRTGEAYDAAALCRELGGGGHARAAGCTLASPLAPARERLLDTMHRNWFTAV